ncbi:MAG: hypothetical protein ABIY37_15785, partial [Devosia sp.]
VLMTKFYFHIRQGAYRFNDGTGAELRSLEDAWNYAIGDARSLIDEHVLEGSIDEHWIEIGDETGAVVASLPFARTLSPLH